MVPASGRSRRRLPALLSFFLAAAAAASFALAAPATVGERIEIRPQDLPPPFATPHNDYPPTNVPRPPGATLNVPEGFRAELFAEGLVAPRWLAVAPNGDLFVSEPFEGRVRVLRDADGDGRADAVVTFYDDDELWRLPHGLAFHDGALYVSDTARVWRFAYEPGQLRASGPPQPVTPAGALGADFGWHYTRNLAFAPDGSRLFVNVGSLYNVDEDPAPYATIQVLDAEDGFRPRTFAGGMRNPVGIAFHPETGDLYVTVVERDEYGDELPPDYLTRVEEGDFFGWPYAYSGPNPDPEFGALRPDLVARTRTPDVMFKAHSTPLGLVFYDAGQFPPEYRGDAFVALHGSWNAAEPRGYAVVRVPFGEDNRPKGWYEVFADGFLVGWEGGPKAWGRPAGLAVAPDGSLLVSDDVGGTIWRIRYDG